MNPSYPPLLLSQPSIRGRRRQKPAIFPLSDQFLAGRLIRSQQVRGQIATVSSALKKLTGEQRKAVFLKLTLDRPITKQDLAGTGLRIMSNPASDETLVVPEEDLGRLDEVVRGFGEKVLKQNEIPPGFRMVTSLQDFRIGDPHDRLSPELRQQYSNLIKSKKGLIFEIEILTFEIGSRKQRAGLDAQIKRIHHALAGSGVIYETDYGESGVRICLWTTGEKFKELVEGAIWQRVIAFFEARPKFETYHTTLADFNAAQLSPIASPPQSAPIICIIDTGVAPGNPFLKPVVRQDLCRSYVAGEADNPWDMHGHGSGVASLAAYYGLSPAKGATNEPKAWIASARILNEHGYMDASTNDIESDRAKEARLLSGVLREIVKDFLPKGVRIFVLPFTIKNRLWNKDGLMMVPRASWLARTIDKLSREFEVVFLTITGNLDENTVAALHSEKPYPDYLTLDPVKVEDPGQSALAITVGSVAHSTKVISPHHTPLALVDQPSPFTRSGPGIGGAIKPDVVERGGNSVFDKGLGRIVQNLPTKILMASNKISPAIAQDLGTSFAAPRVAHHLALILNDLAQFGISNPSNSFLRALLANCSTHELIHKDFTVPANKGWLNTVGYGRPNGPGAVDCDEHRPLLIFDGHIHPDKVALFDIPLPAELAVPGEKLITVSVAHSPPVQQYGLQTYLGVSLKFRLFSGDKSPAAIAQAMSLDDGEENLVIDQHEDFPGNSIGITRRSRGTLQHDIFRITNFSADWTNHPFTLAVSLTEKWGGTTIPVSVAVVVRIQDTTRSASRLYTSIQQTLAQTRVRTRR